MTEITLSVNGAEYLINIDPSIPLLWVLRDELGLTGTKYSCGIGQCGTCTVHVDGEARQSCMVPASSIEGMEITTIEGLSAGGKHPLQVAWVKEHVSQCGYCQPGQLMTAAALLDRNPHPSDEDIIEEMSGVLCRCGTYQRIRNAIKRVVAEANSS
ncbi:MAG: 2Fe-2S iron-sulfur cluster binding domain-containing protein [Anaerolineales bacterium]|nr:2Fe-2S iron-sulfur cluster binding domain-containing protein [Anaerolineales bacterium]